ncbi:M10 family metallopeptidase C-terminal domain-containing protein [Rhizobium sp.]
MLHTPALETRVNTYTDSSQMMQEMIALPDGGWVVTWVSYQDGNSGIYQQIYAADGATYGGETRVSNIQAGRNLLMPQIALLDDGGWVVAWVSDRNGVHQQAFNADGTKQGSEAKVSTNWVGEQVNHQLTVLADGGWVVTWVDDNGDQGGSAGVYQQVFDADGTARGTESRVNTHIAGNQLVPQITALSDGGWVVGWVSDGQDGDGKGVYQQIFNADGTTRGEEAQVNTLTAGNQEAVRITALADGGWVVVWRSPAEEENQWDVYQQVYDEDGSALGGETLVSAGTVASQSDLEIKTLADGGWVVTWAGFSPNFGIYQRVFNADGTAQGDAARASTNLFYQKMFQQSTGLADGGWVVTWSTYTQDGDGLGVYQQAFNADGTARGVETRVNTYTAYEQYGSEVIALADGGWVVSWESRLQDGDGWGIYQQRFDAHGDVYGANHAPESASKTVTVIEDTSYTFTASDFAFVDEEGDIFQHVAITALPPSGTLMLDGVAVTANQQIDVEDLGSLVWTPGKNAFGTFTLTFTVSDDGGTAGGASDTSASHSITFGVADVIDRFNGTRSADTIKGTMGADIIWGGRGADKLTGGDGADTFLFKSIAESTVKANGRDLIKDFSRAEDDLIDLSRIDANTNKKGDQDFDFIGKQRFHDVAGELRFEKTSSGTYVYGDVDGDGVADFAIRLAGKIAFRGDDFLL